MIVSKLMSAIFKAHPLLLHDVCKHAVKVEGCTFLFFK